MANPVGTGPYRLEGVASRPEDRARGEPGIPRRALSRRATRSRRPRAGREAAAASRLPLVERVEISIIEEAQPRLLAFRAGRSRLRHGARPSSSPRCSTRTTRCSRDFAKAGVQPRARRAARDLLHRISTWRIRSSAATRRRRSRCAARSHGATTSNDEIRVLRQGQGDARDPAVPPNVTGHDPDVRRQDPATTSPARRRCSTSSATSIATATAGATCPTASRWSSRWRRRPVASDRQYDELWKKSLDARRHCGSNSSSRSGPTC